MDSLGEILRKALELSRDASAPGQPPPPEPTQEPACSICQGMGWVRHEVPLDHPDFGRAFPCRCQRQAFDAQRLERLQSYSNLGPLTSATFATLRPQGPQSDPTAKERYQRAWEACQAYAREPKGWLALHGPHGAGKTRLAAALANRCLEEGRPALFVSVPDLLDHLRAAYSPSSGVAFDELFEQVRNAPLLVLDDLGAQSATPWAQEKLVQLFNSRGHARLPTVITTSAPLEELEEAIQARLRDPSLCQEAALGPGEPGAVGGGMGDLAMLREMAFATFNYELADLQPPQRASLKRALEAAVKFAEEPRGWMVLRGPNGTGKTHLAAAIANYRLLEGKPALFVVAPDLLDHFRSTFSPDSRITYDALFERVRSSPLLILDDLSTQGVSTWAREKLYQLLNHRYNARLPTVITTASGPEQLDERISSRLKDGSLSVLCTLSDVPDYRERFAGKPQAKRRRPPTSVS